MVTRIPILPPVSASFSPGSICLPLGCFHHPIHYGSKVRSSSLFRYLAPRKAHFSFLSLIASTWRKRWKRTSSLVFWQWYLHHSNWQYFYRLRCQDFRQRMTDQVRGLCPRDVQEAGLAAWESTSFVDSKCSLSSTVISNCRPLKSISPHPHGFRAFRTTLSSLSAPE